MMEHLSPMKNLNFKVEAQQGFLRKLLPVQSNVLAPGYQLHNSIHSFHLSASKFNDTYFQINSKL
jgi:hypothetical protein